VDLGNGVSLDLVLVPAGEFVLGSAKGPRDEYPPTRATIEKPFYMGVFEVTNEQYACFDPRHDSAYISMTNKDHSHRGHAVNQPRQPVVRITWSDAAAFCEWLSVHTGEKFALPSEEQWEWACRAGTGTPFWYGDMDADFSSFANLADAALERFAQRDSPKWHPRDGRFNDRAMVSADVGRYKPNPFGLHDMIGNVAEWTRSDYEPYDESPPGRVGLKTVRGGSWYDRPHRARSAFRLGYRPWQGVFNVGFRVVMAAESPAAVVRAGEGGASAPQ
jgi:formylglycine-generating enzyme required for sulfatase activity